jgi:hypothetical protein
VGLDAIFKPDVGRPTFNATSSWRDRVPRALAALEFDRRPWRAGAHNGRVALAGWQPIPLAACSQLLISDGHVIELRQGW